MSRFVKRKGLLEIHYGWNNSQKEYFYEIYDLTKKHLNKGLIDSAGSRSTSMPPIVLAEKLKRFEAPTEHIQKILWMKKI